jgi:hypothetical protein
VLVSGEYDRLCDLLDEYFMEIKRYNRMLGAYDMKPKEIINAREREALSYSRVLKAKAKLKAVGIEV